MARTWVASPRRTEPEDPGPAAVPLTAPSRHTRTAVIGAVFSAVLVAAMAAAAIACAEGGCRSLPDPSNARVVLEVDPGQPVPAGRVANPSAPIAPGPPPPAAAR
jgi:hypothetical protein